MINYSAEYGSVGLILLLSLLVLQCRYLLKCGLLNVGLPNIRTVHSIDELARNWPAHNLGLYLRMTLVPILLALAGIALALNSPERFLTPQEEWPIDMITYELTLVVGLFGLVYVIIHTYLQQE